MLGCAPGWYDPGAERNYQIQKGDCELSEYRLEMRDVVKTFPGVKALNHAQLKLRPGTVHALMGENGAGKSTLMKCMFGI